MYIDDPTRGWKVVKKINQRGVWVIQEKHEGNDDNIDHDENQCPNLNVTFSQYCSKIVLVNNHSVGMILLHI